MPKPSDRAIAQAFRELVEAESFNVLHHTIIERAKALDGLADFAKSAARERDAAAPAGAQGAVADDSTVARFVEQTAQILSGAPFPSARSYGKAREVADLALSMFTHPPAASEDAADAARYRLIRSRITGSAAGWRRLIETLDSVEDGEDAAAFDRAIDAVRIVPGAPR